MLPQNLRATLQGASWFEELSQANFDRMMSIAHLQEVEVGEKLFKEGDKEDYLYLVLEGRVALEIFVPHRGLVRLYTAGPMDVIGWASVTPVVRQRTAAASAVMPTRLVAFDAQALRRLCDENHELGYVVMRRLANVVASRLQVSRLQLLDMFAIPEGAHV